MYTVVSIGKDIYCYLDVVAAINIDVILGKGSQNVIILTSRLPSSSPAVAPMYSQKVKVALAEVGMVTS